MLEQGAGTGTVRRLSRVDAMHHFGGRLWISLPELMI